MVTVSEHALDSGERRRRYLLLQPREQPAGSLPVVIDLHGSGISPEDYLLVTGARLLARQAVVVVPEAAVPFDVAPYLPPAASAAAAALPPATAWNIPGTPLPGEQVVQPDGVDDTAFLRDLIDDLVARHGADPARIHLRGYSGGARLAAHVAAALPDRLASIGCVAGVRFPPSPAPAMPAVLAIHGRRDHLNRFDGAVGPHWDESVESAVSRWARHAGCVTSAEEAIEEGVHEIRYQRADGSSPVRLIIVDQAQHAWPGTTDQRHAAIFGDPATFSAATAYRQFIEEIDALNASHLPT